jgi:hypothetical protein
VSHHGKNGAAEDALLDHGILPHHLTDISNGRVVSGQDRFVSLRNQEVDRR